MQLFGGVYDNVIVVLGVGEIVHSKGQPVA